MYHLFIHQKYKFIASFHQNKIRQSALKLTAKLGSILPVYMIALCLSQRKFRMEYFGQTDTLLLRHPIKRVPSEKKYKMKPNNIWYQMKP